MKTTFGWLAGIAAGVAVLALALVAARMFGGNAFKSEIEARFKSRTGLELSIAGDVSLSLFPGLGVKLGHTELRNPPGFGDENLGGFDALSVRVKLLPLLGGTIAPGAISVDGLNIHLRRSASGRHNFENFLAPDGDADGPASALLALGGLKISSATVTYLDRASGESLRITDLDLRTGPLSASRPAPVTARFRFIDSARSLDGYASLAAELSTDPPQRTVRARPLTIEMTLRGAGMRGGGLQLQASAYARFDAHAHLLSLENVKLAGKRSGIGEALIEVNVPHAAVDLSAGTVAPARFALTAAGLDIDGEFTAGGLGTDPTLKGRLTVASFSPAELMARLGGPLPDKLKAVLPDEARFVTSVSGDINGLTLEFVSFALDRIRATGRMELGFTPGWPLTTALRIGEPSDSGGSRPQLTLRGSGRSAEGTSAYQVEELELTLGPASARGKVEVDASGDELTYTASLALDKFDARALLEYLGQPAPRTADPETFTRVVASAVVTGGGTDLVLEPLTLELDETRITGSLSVSDMLKPERAVNFALRADTLDAGRYLPLSDPGVDGGAGAAALLGLVRSLNLAGRLSLGTLAVGDVVMEEVQLVARSTEGRLEPRTGSASHLSPLSAHIAASDLHTPWP